MPLSVTNTELHIWSDFFDKENVQNYSLFGYREYELTIPTETKASFNFTLLPYLYIWI